MKQSKGFTLIELMIVIAVLGILGTMATFSFQRYVTNANLKTAAREIMTDMSLCKQKAMSEGIQYRLTFTVGSDQYAISAAPFSSSQTKSLAQFGAGMSVQSVNFTSGQVIFLPRGTLSSNTGTVVLVNSRNSTATITVNITGRTYVAYNMQ